MKIVGLCIARDEELCVGMTVETAKDVIDELVLVDHMSKDRTVKIVTEQCDKFGIKLHMFQEPLTESVADLRKTCVMHAQRVVPDADWFLNMDADTVFSPDIDLRALAESDNYASYWFHTMDLYGDMTRTGGLNMPHLWLFKNTNNITAPGNYDCPGHSFDPNKERFIGWNLNGLHTVEHMFWRFQIWYQRLWNAGNGTRYGVDEFIETYFQGQPTDYYIKTFVLNRMRNLSLSVERAAGAQKPPLSVDEFTAKYRNFPDCLRNWVCPFTVTVDPADDRVISRDPDILDVPVLTNAELQQLEPVELNKFRAWRTW